MNDQTLKLQQQILSAFKNKSVMRIEGGNSKYFLGNASSGDLLTTQNHMGIISYDASELVITARSGTPLIEIKQALAENNQMLAFEPPAYADNATLGGTVACNLSGPARPYMGAARDFVLGSKIINGKGEVLQFGGQVIKNVAGYDASRLMAGAYGTLGLLLEVSLKVLPVAGAEITLIIELSANQAIEKINQLSGKNLPVSASCYVDKKLYIRLSSSEKNVEFASKTISHLVDAQQLKNSTNFWDDICEHRHDFFKTDKTLWRLSVPPTCKSLNIEGEQFIEWGGACRWLKTDISGEKIREIVKAEGGHATAYRNCREGTGCFMLLDKNVMLLHKRLKNAFDPEGILNPGRLYKEL